MLSCHLFILFGEISLHVFCLFSGWIVCFITVEFSEFFIYSRYWSFIRFVVCKYFLTFFSLSFPLNMIFHRTKTFNFDEVQLISYMDCAVASLKTFCLALNPEDFLHIFSKCFLVLCFTCKSMTYFEVVFF